MTFHILGMSSSQLTKSIIFQRSRLKPPTRYIYIYTYDYRDITIVFYGDYDPLTNWDEPPSRGSPTTDRRGGASHHLLRGGPGGLGAASAGALRRRGWAVGMVPWGDKKGGPEKRGRKT